jgi:CheY-like chemotaxis protein
VDAEFLKAFPMGSVKILVVDDFEEFRRLVCSALQQGPEFQVTLAPDGLEAVQKAKESQPDLILLDIGLPNLNGLEVARRVHALGPVRILFVSGLSDPEVVREALGLGAAQATFIRNMHRVTCCLLSNGFSKASDLFAATQSFAKARMVFDPPCSPGDEPLTQH